MRIELLPSSSYTRFQWFSQEVATEAYNELVETTTYITRTISFRIVLILSSHNSYVSDVISFLRILDQNVFNFHVPCELYISLKFNHP